MARIVVIVAALILALGLFYRWRILQIPGARITSWFRTPWHNDEVGGVVNSRHQVGLAFDVVPASRSMSRALQKIGFALVLDEGTHIHVEVV